MTQKIQLCEWLSAYFVEQGKIDKAKRCLKKARAAESYGEIVQLCTENVEALKKASVFMKTNAYDKALQHIEHSHLVHYSGEELPLNLKIRAGICHIHLGNMEKKVCLCSCRVHY
ncbi:hypothetical protein LWI29_003593 [Acer saccharum]|uniref:Uncharacterized protein n=1 Tax=Acer saccharum TaxID=4024 RepID=A0AA39SL68_ACESA|nr:hypothetical protein LWI29_003593 [Acer saccharum]